MADSHPRLFDDWSEVETDHAYILWAQWERPAVATGSVGSNPMRLTKLNVVERLVALADLPPERTKNNITGQVNALKSIAEIEGYVVNRYEDLTKEFAGRTDVEKEFFASHGYWPNEVEPSQPGSFGSESASKDPGKPN